MTVGELYEALENLPAEAEVFAFTEFTAQYGDGVYVHVEKVELRPCKERAVELGGACVLVEDFS